MLSVIRIDRLTDVQSDCKNVSNASKIDIRGYTRGDPKVTGNIFWWAGPL